MVNTYMNLLSLEDRLVTLLIACMGDDSIYKVVYFHSLSLQNKL